MVCGGDGVEFLVWGEVIRVMVGEILGSWGNSYC